MTFLPLSRMSVGSSIQWLLDNDDDPDVDTPIPGMEIEDEPLTMATPTEDSIGATGGISQVCHSCNHGNNVMDLGII